MSNIKEICEDLFLEYVDKYNMKQVNNTDEKYYINIILRDIYYNFYYYVDDYIYLTIGMRSDVLQNIIPDFGEDMNNFIKRLPLFDIVCGNRENTIYYNSHFFTFKLFKLREL